MNASRIPQRAATTAPLHRIEDLPRQRRVGQRSIRTFAFASAIALVASLEPTVTAAKPKESSPVPVTVEGDVTVQGGVEVVNDVLYTPFWKTASQTSSSGVLTLHFDIPEGKRLVIETVAVHGDVQAGENLRADFRGGELGNSFSVRLPLQPAFSAATGWEAYGAVVPMKVRIDAIPGEDAELAVFATSFDGMFVAATIFGYLIDL